MELTTEQALQQGVAAHKEGKLQDAERLYRVILQSYPLHPHANHNLGVLAVSDNRADVALPLFKTALDANPSIEQFWLSYIDALIKEKHFVTAENILDQAKKQGLEQEKLNVLRVQLASIKEQENVSRDSPSQAQLNSLWENYQNGRFSDAEKVAISITQEFPMHQDGWKVLGAVFRQTNRIPEAANAYQKVVELSPQDPEAHYNLGNALKGLGKLDKAEARFKQAIALKTDFAEAKYNLGNTLQELDRLKEAEASFRHAIELKPDFAEAHHNLGFMLQELDRLEEAEASFRQAIELKPDFVPAHLCLGINLYIKRDMTSALGSIQKAIDIEPEVKLNKALYAVIQARDARGKAKLTVENDSNPVSSLRLLANPFVTRMDVKPGLIATLAEMQSREMDKALHSPVYGNGRCSIDYNLFDNAAPTIKTVENDLVSVMKQAVKSDVYVLSSFFNIYGAKAGIPPHTHLNEIDTEKHLHLAEQKYSLVYYLSVGDQNCSEPGILKLFDPNEDILPCEGMIVIIPADRQHSAVYGGKKDRVMIGVNFYSL